MASRTELVYSQFPLHSIETFFIRHSKDVFNRLEFSRALEEARALADVESSLVVTDIDAMVLVDGSIVAAFELKSMRERVANYGGFVKVNGKQYEAHMKFVLRTGIDLYYLVKVDGRDGRYFYLWSVKRAPVRFEWLGDKARGTYDYYALVRKDGFVSKITPEELPYHLSTLIFGR